MAVTKPRFTGITLTGGGVAIPVLNEDGSRRTREELTQIVTQVNAETNGGYMDATHSHNYAMDRLESRWHKVKQYDCPQLLRKRTIMARLQNKLIRKNAGVY